MTVRHAPRRILLIQLRRFGDVVLTTALLEDLRRAFPSVPIDFLVGAPAAPLLEQHPLIDERLIYDQDHPTRTWRAVRARRYDWVIDVQSSPRTAPLTLLSGASTRVGWEVRGWGWVYTHRLPRSGRAPEYVVRERQRLLELVGVQVHRAHPRLYLTAAEREAGERDVRAAGAPADRPRVGIVLTAGELSKYWLLERFAEVAESLSRAGVTPLVFGTLGDDARIRELQRSAPRAVVVPPLDIRRFLGALATCRVLVSSDTGPVHMATAINVPSVTIFGPTSPTLWSPRLPTTAVVRDERVPCLECQHAVCPIGHDCMVGVSADAVLARVRDFLGLAELTPIARR